jgi:hypothetical protein
MKIKEKIGCTFTVNELELLELKMIDFGDRGAFLTHQILKFVDEFGYENPEIGEESRGAGAKEARYLYLAPQIMKMLKRISIVNVCRMDKTIRFLLLRY